MEGVEFIKGLDKDKVYIMGFDIRKWDAEQISDLLTMTREEGLNIIGVFSDGLQLIEPIGVDKDKLKELLNA